MFIIQKKTYNFLIIFALGLTSSTCFAAEWPKTFSGQPDFDFNRETIIKEIKENELPEQQNNLLTTLENMLHEKAINPFLNSAQVATDDELNLPELTGSEELNIVSGQLPTIEGTTISNRDLEEFQKFLEQIIEKKREIAKKDIEKYNFQSDVEKIAIQSIVTSPQKYAIINKKRYEEGDRFILPVRIVLVDKGLEELINQYLPNEKTVDAETYQEYLNLRDSAIQAYIDKVGQQNVNTVTHNVSVSVRKILHRKVILSIFGVEYTLKMKLTL